MRTKTALGAAALLAIGLTACSEAAADPADTPTGSPTEEAAGETIEITGVDFGFEGLPETVDVGTTLTFTNASDVEAHEMVVFKIDDDRPLEELLELPEDEAMAYVQFRGQAFAMPGEDGTVLTGDAITLEEPGRYALLCFIPTGADPDAVADAMEHAGEDAPEIDGGPPHFVRGMSAEFTVS